MQLRFRFPLTRTDVASAQSIEVNKVEIKVDIEFGIALKVATPLLQLLTLLLCMLFPQCPPPPAHQTCFFCCRNGMSMPVLL